LNQKRVMILPYRTVNDVDLYYEIHGPSGAPPIVFIGGWASYLWVWFRQIPAFKYRFRCIVFDNRGAGRSSKPDNQYTMEMFADDVVGLMEALHIESAHILGISMGGMIAQQIAISYPEKVRSLIIVSSNFGGPNAVPMPDKTMALLIAVPTETISKEQAREMRFRATFSSQFIKENRSVLEQIEKWMDEYPTPLYAQVHQSSAVAAFEAENELKQISIPTLILQGDSDIAMLPKNAELLANRISTSRLVLIEGGSHFSIIEKYSKFNNEVMSFIDEVEKGQFSPEPKKKTI
jgi:proline-specific peptidase